MTGAERWIAAAWPVVHGLLPARPARVVELGCGPHGGFVPLLRSNGYEAVGIDPQAPDGPEYRRVEFDRAGPFEHVDAVVASASLHHVADPAETLDRIAGTLRRRGVLVVVEWAWEDVDEATAQWCFARLEPDAEGWLHRRRAEWEASGLEWERYFEDWARRERLHPAATLLQLLDERFEREHLARGPYFFLDLTGTSEEDERAAIEAGEIRATRVDYAGRSR